MYEYYKFVNTPLPYAYNAMEPYIDEKTMKLHHDRHLQTYIDDLNNALSNYPEFQGWTLFELLVNIPSLPQEIQTEVKNNAGGVFNHQFYFNNLANPSPPAPTGELGEAILNEYGSLDLLKGEFKGAGLSVFGSGYAWLVVNANGQLKIITTANQDTPLPMGMCPVLNIDVWEHAYYLKHYNRRTDYIDDWFHVVNWDRANENYVDCFAAEF